MTTIRKFRGERCYAKISNKLLQNSKLSFKARGLMAYILSLPDSWELCSEHLYNCSEQDGRTAVQSAIRELVKFGYLGTEITRDALTGQIESKGYVAYDDPSENPSVALPIGQEAHKAENLSNGETTTIKETSEIKEIGDKGNTLVGSATPSSPASRKKVVSDAEFMAELKSNIAFAGIDIEREAAKMRAWCQANGKQPTRRRFVNWLNRADKPMAIPCATIDPLRGPDGPHADLYRRF